MARFFIAILVLFATSTAFADEKVGPPKVETPPAVALPAPVTATDTPKPPEPVPVACILPPLTMPVQFTAIIREELVIANRNNAAITAYGSVYKSWAEKRADYDICKINKKDCKDPGKMPVQPKLNTSFLEHLNKAGKEQSYQSFYGNVGNWLVCAELTRADALGSCQSGNSAPLTTLEQDLKKACPLVIDRRRR